MRSNRLVLAVALVLGAQGAAHADLPEGVYYSDFDASFDVETQSSGREDQGWVLEAAGRLYGDGIPAQSTLEYVVKDGNRELMRVRCEANLEQRELGYAIAEGVPGLLNVRNCRDRTQKSTAVGPVEIEVYFVDGSDDSKTLVRTHRLEVRRVQRVGAAPIYYIPVNGEIAASVIHECPQRSRCLQNSARQSPGYLGLFFWAAPAKDNGPEDQQRDQQEFVGIGTQLVCSVNGTRLPLSQEPRFNEVRGVRVRHVFGEGRQNERIDYTFRRYHATLPIIVGESAQGYTGRVALADHDGQWSCELRVRGNAVRTFSFRAEGGHVVPHPEETAENGLRLPPGGHYVEMQIPEGTRVETRVDPAAAASAFYGRAWVTDEARAAAQALPSVGDAQIPSEPAARGARAVRAGRGGRGRR